MFKNTVLAELINSSKLFYIVGKVFFKVIIYSHEIECLSNSAIADFLHVIPGRLQVI